MKVQNNNKCFKCNINGNKNILRISMFLVDIFPKLQYIIGMDQEAPVSGYKNLKPLSLKLPSAILSIDRIRHPASGIRHPASGIRHPASGIRQ